MRCPLALVRASLCLSLLLVTGALYAKRPSFQEQRINIVLIVDTSKSMRGVGGTTNIFSQVLETCKAIVREKLKPGDRLSLLEFDSDVVVNPTVTVESEVDRLRLNQLLDRMRADGDYTYTAKALQVGLEEAERLERLSPGYEQVIIIITDGRNDPPPGAQDALSLEQVARRYEGKPWYVYQVQLGGQPDSELEEATRILDGEIINDAGGVNLPRLTEQVLPTERREQPEDTSLTPISQKPGHRFSSWLLLSLPFILGIALFTYLKLRPNYSRDIFFRVEETDLEYYPSRKAGTIRRILYANKDLQLDDSFGPKTLRIRPDGEVVSVSLEDDRQIEVSGQPLVKRKDRVLYAGESLVVEDRLITFDRKLPEAELM